MAIKRKRQSLKDKVKIRLQDIEKLKNDSSNFSKELSELDYGHISTCNNRESRKKYIQEKISLTRKHINKIELEITELKHQSEKEKNIRQTITSNKSIDITDHAVLRYIERMNLLDIEEIKNTILDNSVRDKIREYGGNGKFLQGSLMLVCKQNTIVTIYDNKI